MTEALSIAALPESIREICRACEITSKSLLLLQIVRQPDDESMQAMAEQIAARRIDPRRRAQSPQGLRSIRLARVRTLRLPVRIAGQGIQG